MPDPVWHLRGESWERNDGVWLTRHGPACEVPYVWKATRPLPDDQGRWVVDIEAPNVFVAMDDVDVLWPIPDRRRLG